MVVEIDPSGSVQGDSCQQNRTRKDESSEYRNEAGNGSGDHEGQANTVEWSEHVFQIRSRR